MKVGDRVVIVTTIFMNEGLQPGKKGVVSLIRDDIYGIEMDIDPFPEDGVNLWPFYESELEVIQ